jgi:hypothetical protein
VRDDPAARLALTVRTYREPTGRARRHLPFRRAALSFMRWQTHRGVLSPLDASPARSVWWRAVNERLLRDGCESVALVGGLEGEPSSQPVRPWLEFIAKPTGRNWYRAHNASIVGAYLEHRGLAEAENPAERYIADEQGLGRILDYAVIVPRLQRIYQWSAVELGEPRALELARDGNPIYAWPFEERHVWRSPHMRPVGRGLRRATRAR